MRSHLRATVAENTVDYSLLFREMFCVAAQSLADSMSLPLEHLGVAYDQILETGIIRRQGSLTLRHSSQPTVAMFGRGQFLFLVKHATKSEASHFTSTGFRFGMPSAVIGPIARAMQIDRLEVQHQLGKMVGYHGSQNTFRPGVHIGFFGMRPNIQRGFNVVVNERQTHSIPSLQLPIASLDDQQKAFVMSFSGKSVEEILTELRIPQTPRMDYDLQTFRYPIRLMILMKGRIFTGLSYHCHKKSTMLLSWMRLCFPNCLKSQQIVIKAILPLIIWLRGRLP
jgi:hypothetical protein